MVAASSYWRASGIPREYHGEQLDSALRMDDRPDEDTYGTVSRIDLSSFVGMVSMGRQEEK